MKKNKKIFVSVVLLVALSILSIGVLSGCSNPKKFFEDVYSQYTSSVKSMTYYDNDMKKTKSLSLKGSQNENDFATIDLGEVVEFNTITLVEESKSVTKFSIYASNEIDKNYKLIYNGDTIESGRVCYTDTQKYRYLRVFVTSSDKSYNVKSINVYNNKNENAKDFRTNTYLVMDSINEESDLTALKTVDEIIAFGTLRFDKNGDIQFYNSKNEVSEEEEKDKYEKNLNMIKEYLKENNSDAKIYVDVLMPFGVDGDNNIYAREIMSTHIEKATDNIKNLVESYGFDGYDIDYEYPNNSKEWKYYNNFLRKVDEKLGDKILSVACSAWALKYDKDVIEKIDRFELMTYDMFDKHGYHGAFASSMLDGLTKAYEKGIDIKKINLGLPFYSRPTNGHAYWGSYNQFYDMAGKDNNLVYFEDFDHDGNPMTAPQYFNSYQMIQDKIAFLIDAKVGGAMVWHYSCDVNYDKEYSLFKAIYTTKTQKAIA